MRDERYKAVHRGGSLKLENHHLLAIWAAECVEHKLHLFTELYPEDDRPLKAIEAARAWSRGEITVGEARTAAVAAHAAARDAEEGAARFVARAAGHAAGTAHMADHASGAAAYVIKAVKAATDKNEAVAAKQEYNWQQQRLPENMRELIQSTFEKRLSFLGI